MASPLLPEIERLIAAETTAAVDLIADGGEVIIRGLSIRHGPAGRWFVEIPPAQVGLRAYPARDQRDALEQARFQILKALRAEHKTPEAVHAALQKPAIPVRVYRGQGIRISIYREDSVLVYELTGQGITPAADFWHGPEAELLHVLLSPMGLALCSGQIVVQPAILAARATAGLVLRTTARYPTELPAELEPFYCYPVDCGHSILVVPAGRLADEHSLVPAPVKTVLRLGWTLIEGMPVVPVAYDPQLGLVADPADEEW